MRAAVNRVSTTDGRWLFGPAHRAHAFMWVAVGHFLQYLWITTYFAAASESTGRRPVHLGKALLAGISIWTVPTLIFAPDLLGSLPYDLGLGLLAASAVNIHHFILDGGSLAPAG